ncbi:MAG: hypothetical protein R6V85_09205 [Polyangia bacterium]
MKVQRPVKTLRTSDRLPEYRLSKFQRAMPGAASLEMVGGYLLGVKATRKWLESDN